MLLATLNAVRREIGKLRLNTSSCLIGPFTFTRLLTQIEALLEQKGAVVARDRFGITSLSVSLMSEGIDHTKGHVILADGRFDLLRFFVHRRKRILPHSLVTSRI